MGECINPIKEEPVHSPWYCSARSFYNTTYPGEIMPETDPDDDCQKPSAPSDLPEGFSTDMPVNMTLENILDLTGEMEHLNELIMLSLDKEGGFTSA